MPFPIPSSQNLQIPKRNNINPLLSLVVKRVCSVCDETDGETQRERKRNQAFKIKSGALLYSSFPRCSKPKAKLFGSHKCISLCCLFVWGVGVRIKKTKKKHRRRRRREKRKEFFFERRPKTLNVKHTKKQSLPFFLLFSLLLLLLFVVTVFIVFLSRQDFLSCGSLSLSLSLSLFDVNDERGFWWWWWWWFYARCFCFCCC